MKSKKLLIIVFILSLSIYIISIARFLNQPTDVIIAHYISDDHSSIFPDELSLMYLKKVKLSYLKENAIFPERSLITTIINVSSGFSVVDSKYYQLLDLIIAKGESVESLFKSKCNYVDHLIMSGDIKLFKYLAKKGLSIPNVNDKEECTNNILEQYKFRYTDDTYLEMKQLLSEF